MTSEDKRRTLDAEHYPVLVVSFSFEETTTLRYPVDYQRTWVIYAALQEDGLSHAERYLLVLARSPFPKLYDSKEGPGQE